MITKVVPSLTSEGWITDTAKRADFLMAHFFESEYSQTFFYPKRVSSFQYILQKNQGKMFETVREVRETLYSYFLRYFKDVVVQVDHTEEQSNSSRIALSIFISFKDESNVEFTVGRLANIVESKLQKVIIINNELGA